MRGSAVGVMPRTSGSRALVVASGIVGQVLADIDHDGDIWLGEGEKQPPRAVEMSDAEPLDSVRRPGGSRPAPQPERSKATRVFLSESFTAPRSPAITRAA